MNHHRFRNILPAAVLGVVAVALYAGCQSGFAATIQKAPVQTFRVLHVYPHDPDAFTQGLIFKRGFLFESTGLEGHSSLRKVELETGRVVQKTDLSSRYFAEGLTDWDDLLIQLTWVSHAGFVYDRQTFRKRRQFAYTGEGWGLTHDEKSLIMSDGSATLRYLDSNSFKVLRKLEVKDGNDPVQYLNELEYIRGEIFANVWQTDRVACISPKSGQVRAWLDLSGLLSLEDRTAETDVLNGIAYDPASRRIFVTGKKWPKLFEIEIVDQR